MIYEQPVVITPRTKTVDLHGHTTWTESAPLHRFGLFAPQHLAEDAVTVVPAKVYFTELVHVDSEYLVDVANQRWQVVSATVWPLGVEVVIERWHG